MKDIVLIITTFPEDDSANIIAEKLISNKLAACVNIIPGIKSIYFWENKICNDSEKLVLIKTTKEKADFVYSFIKENHPYSVPERLTLEVINAGDDYSKWLINYIHNKFI